MSNDRYPKRTAKVIEKKFLSSELIRIFFRLDNTIDLPIDLVGSHIKLFPFNDDYMKSYTISTSNEDIVSLDIHLHLKGRGSNWANDCQVNDEVAIWGPKKAFNNPIDLSSSNILLVCDLCGLSTMISIISKMKHSVKGDLIVKSAIPIDLGISKGVEVSFVESIDLDSLTQQVKEYDDIFVILGIKDIKYLNSIINITDNIRLKAYWK